MPYVWRGLRSPLGRLNTPSMRAECRERRGLVSVTSTSFTHLADIVCGGRPKGYVNYAPHRKNAVTAERIVELYSAMYEADALPLGPRTAGYRLKERYVGEYDKNDF